MALKLSVITPFSRGLKELDQLMRDFRNQTMPKSAWEHIIVRDGDIPPDIQDHFDRHKDGYNVTMVSIKKDPGDMRIAPGTRPRNHGVTLATGEFVAFCDDDDRYKDTYCEVLCSGSHENMIAVTQMSCQESRMYRNGQPGRIVLIPEVGVYTFPIICHVGTPCFTVRRTWAMECPWQHEPEHDFRFIKRICEKYHPTINIIPGMQVDVDGLVLKGLQDWVSHPPFFRGDR